MKHIHVVAMETMHTRVLVILHFVKWDRRLEPGSIGGESSTAGRKSEGRELDSQGGRNREGV